MIVNKGGPNNTGGILLDWDHSKVFKPEDNYTSAYWYRHTVSKFYEAPLIPDIYSY